MHGLCEMEAVQVQHGNLCRSKAAYASACFLCMEGGSFGVRSNGHLELLPSAWL